MPPPTYGRYTMKRELSSRGAATPEHWSDGRKKQMSWKSSSQVASRNASGGCLYVSGPPGTGKSALVGQVCQQLPKSGVRQFAYLNCMSIKSVVDVYATLAAELDMTDDIFTADMKTILQTKFLGAADDGVYVVVLDEIDQLLSLDLDVLYNLFEWSMDPHSQLVLIGIANALDLTDRFLPRLKARNLRPLLLPFLPYTAQEIASVLTARVRSLLPPGSTVEKSFTPFLHPAAIQLISKKVSAQSGDIRKAFDLARRAIDLTESETKTRLVKEHTNQLLSPPRGPLSENRNLSSPTSFPADDQNLAAAVEASLNEFNPESAPRATLAHIVRVTAAAFSNGTTQRLKTLNLQQKAVLCSLIALERQNRQAHASSHTNSTSSKRALMTPTKAKAATAPRIREIYEMYCLLCKRDDTLHALSGTEFRDVIGSLESLSLIHTADGKAATLAASVTPSKRGRAAFATSGIEDRRVATGVGIEEMEGAVEGAGSGDGILRGMLRGEAL